MKKIKIFSKTMALINSLRDEPFGGVYNPKPKMYTIEITDDIFTILQKRTVDLNPESIHASVIQATRYLS